MITTALTRLFGIQHPVVLGPMGAVAGGALTAAVSNAGGLGLVGGGYGDIEWVRREVALAKASTAKPWGVGFITWSASREVVELALAQSPHAVMLSFGDPRPHAALIKAAGCKLICQVQGLDEARLAVEAGADLIVAQGTEGGGHGGIRATLPLVPAIVDRVGPIPVIAAGGIADGRGLAAALMLGAEGALLGTRFYATPEAIGHDKVKARIVQASGGETMRTTVFDAVRGYDWAGRYTGRAVRNGFMERWHGRPDQAPLREPATQQAYWQAAAEGNVDTAVVWAGENADLITRIEPAGEIVQRIAREAEALLAAAASRLR